MIDSLRHIRTIAKRELTGYFSSPVAYVVIVIFLLLIGFFTFMLGQFFRVGEASLTFSFFRWHPWLYLFLVPAVGMRLWAEERRQGTMELLLTMPITAWQAIVGKFLASWLFLIIALALTFPVVMTVSYLGNPDGGAVFTGYLGSALLAGAYLAVTSFTSALTRNQVISFILSVVICFFLILCGWEPVTDMLQNVSPYLVKLVSSFSVMPHFTSFQRGVIDSRDLLFFLSVIGFSLFCNGVVIRNLRAG
ncbi:MAG TPA: ABC transporter permease [Candidatus Limnocylindria bacterium]|nr:ABC transporter permease [Candidatus Limnocylindria bacterium]